MLDRLKAMAAEGQWQEILRIAPDHLTAVDDVQRAELHAILAVAYAGVAEGPSDWRHALEHAHACLRLSESGGFRHGWALHMLAVRVRDIDNFIMLQNRSDTTSYVLYKRVTGTFTSIGTIAQAPATNDLLEILLRGSSIEVFINGVSKLTVTESAHQTETKHGFGGYNSDTTSRFDDFGIVR